jgi:hypothetical protein
MMKQHVAGTLNQYPNLIELIGRQSELHGTSVWWELAIGSDELDGIDQLPAAHDNFLQDEIVNGPLNAVSITGHEAIGQDEAGSPPAKLDKMSICNDEALLQDEAPALNGTSICSDETETIGQDEIQGSPQAARLDAISICNDETFLQDEAPDVAQ